MFFNVNKEFLTIDFKSFENDITKTYDGNIDFDKAIQKKHKSLITIFLIGNRLDFHRVKNHL